MCILEVCFLQEFCRALKDLSNDVLEFKGGSFLIKFKFKNIERFFILFSFVPFSHWIVGSIIQSNFPNHFYALSLEDIILDLTFDSTRNHPILCGNTFKNGSSVKFFGDANNRV